MPGQLEVLASEALALKEVAQAWEEQRALKEVLWASLEEPKVVLGEWAEEAEASQGPRQG